MNELVKKAMETDDVQTEPISLENNEKECFVDHAGEFNYLLKKIFASDGRGGSAAELAMYAFRLGREFEKKEKKHGWF